MGAGTKLPHGWEEACSFVLQQGMVSFYRDLRFHWTNLCLFKDLNHQWSSEFQVWFLRELEGTGQTVDLSTSVSQPLPPVCRVWLPAHTAEERIFSSRFLKRQGKKKKSMLRMQSLPESHGRAEVGQGMKVLVLFFEDFLSDQDHLSFSGGRLRGSSTEVSNPSRAKAPWKSLNSSQ